MIDIRQTSNVKLCCKRRSLFSHLAYESIQAVEPRLFLQREIKDCNASNALFRLHLRYRYHHQ